MSEETRLELDDLIDELRHRDYPDEGIRIALLRGGLDDFDVDDLLGVE